jgi:hypothetical protein
VLVPKPILSVVRFGFGDPGLRFVDLFRRILERPGHHSGQQTPVYALRMAVLPVSDNLQPRFLDRNMYAVPSWYDMSLKV